MPIQPDMYTVIGTYSDDGSQCRPLTYPTLAEALKRLQDLIEADECEIAYGETEERGIRMFVQYTVIPHTVVDVVATYTSPPTPTPTAPPTPPPSARPPAQSPASPHEPGKPPQLRLVRE